MTSSRHSLKGTIKGAELASSLGAIFLGAGLGMLAPATLGGLAVLLLITGLLVHGAGMTFKYRLEGSQRDPARWEQALFWLCWIGLGAVGAWLAWRHFG